MADIFILDTGSAYTLANIDGLDALLDGGRRVVITDDILKEIGDSLDYGNKIKDWIGLR